ncbi:hypothetical protein PG996_007542 [Apiospora saccharicola]|uniref:Uncharacterized protein n=1 Tax=Apiospora saccharicola TaxID=335842 RepID=A0ABR1VB47_9PEZI
MWRPANRPETVQIGHLVESEEMRLRAVEKRKARDREMQEQNKAADINLYPHNSVPHFRLPRAEWHALDLKPTLSPLVPISSCRVLFAIDFLQSIEESSCILNPSYYPTDFLECGKKKAL